MLATSLSSDVWIGTALIAAIAVLSCMGVICTRLRYDTEFITTVANVKKLRDKLAKQLDEAGAQAAEQPSAVSGGAGSAGLATPTNESFDSDDSANPADSDGSVGTEQIATTEVDPEPVTPATADAA